MKPSSVRVAAAAAGAALLTTLLSVPATAAPQAAPVAGQAPRRADYDSRESPTAEPPATTLRSSAAAEPSGAAVRDLRARLGVQGVVEIDRATGTPRRVVKLDGFLTGPSRQQPAAVALGYVEGHPEIFGLDPASLRLRKDYVDIAGTHHLSFQQTVDGVPVFGNGLKAHVTKDGRLLQIDGSPLKALPADAGTAKLGAAEARAAAVRDVFGTSTARPTTATRFSDGGAAELVLFQTAAGARLAWQTVTLDEGYLHVVDAATGEVLYRRSTLAADTGEVFRHHPGAARGGTQQRVDLGRWLPSGATRLSGNVAHVYADVNDDDKASPAEEVGPSAPRRWDYPFTNFNAAVGGLCSDSYPCSWDPQTANSWQVNRAQNAVQMMYFLGTWYDHLKAAPIGFTRAAGNFEAVDGDAVQGQAMDGAAIAGGLPDGAHVNNANMNTPPDGMAPTMQMYLFRPSARFIAGNSGDDPSVVFHEYGHGLSNRLVVDADGNSTLGDIQAGAMGEAWGDWYAMDYLVEKGYVRDSSTAGDVRLAQYLTAGAGLRTEGIDCTVGAPAGACPGTAAAGPGGFTYGDLGKIAVSGNFEVHEDGEIWAQTLWDLRSKVGSRTARALVTRAMELSPANPSYLDMRNSVLAADLVVSRGKLQKTLWQVFAKRGMGYFAASIDGDDLRPVEDFSTPPAANTPRGTLTGKVTDQDTGAAVAGLTVGFGGHTSGFAGDLLATTAADGTYTIDGILPGTYAKVFARGAGYDLVVRTLSISSHTVRADWAVRRDWAAASGGGTVVSATGPDYTPYGCGPAKLIDQSQAAGWGSEIAAEGQHIVVGLPAAVDITDLVINPSATCGDDVTAGTGGYRVETSPDGTAWTPAASGTFPAGAATPTSVALAAGSGDGVRFIRYTMLTSQAQDAGRCPGAVSGCLYLDSTELAVYGSAG